MNFSLLIRACDEDYLEFRNARINLLLRLSSLVFCKDTTAQMAAGNHPITVICRMRQTIPDINLPRKRKESQGSKTARKVTVIDFGDKKMVDQ